MRVRWCVVSGAREHPTSSSATLIHLYCKRLNKLRARQPCFLWFVIPPTWPVVSWAFDLCDWQVWLNPRDLPAPQDMRCGECSQPLSFLVQLYCPLDHEDDAFHRCLYVFCCPKVIVTSL